MNSLLLATSAFDIAINKLRTGLFLISFVLVVIGIWEGGWKAGGDPKAILGIVLKTIIIVTFIANFPTIMKQGQATFDNLREKITQNTISSQDAFKKKLTESIKPAPDVWRVGDYIAYIIVVFLQFFGKIGVKIVEYFQQYAIGCLIAISPLMIGLLAISHTQNIGIKFLLKSLEISMWSLGFILADLFLNYLGSGVMAGILSAEVGAPLAATAAAISWPAAVGTMLIAALVPTFLYLATPMAVASLMSGANAGAAAAWGGLSNMSQTAQQVTRGGAALQQMKAAASGTQTGSQNTASSGGTIPRPPNPIV